MRAILDIALNDLRIIFGDRGIWLNLVIIPLAIAYAVGFANSGGGGGVPTAERLVVDVIDHDGGEIVGQFFSDLTAANENIVLCPLTDDADDICGLDGAALDDALATERLEAQESLALIEIPADFSAAIAAGETATIVYRSNEEAVAPSFILQAVQAATQRLGGALTAARVGTDAAAETLDFADDAERAAFAADVRQRAGALWASDPVQVAYTVAQQPEADESDSTSGFSQSIPGIGTMYVMFAILPASGAILLERKNWTLQRLATMPISRAQVLGGKLLSRFLLGMIQYGVMFGFGALLGVHYGHDPLALLLVMVSLTLAATALMLALTAVLKNPAQASGIALFLSLTLAPLGGAWWPLDIVPAWLRTVGHISPIAWAMDGFQALMFFDGGLSDVIVPCAVLLAMAAVLFAFGVARFRFNE